MFRIKKRKLSFLAVVVFICTVVEINAESVDVAYFVSAQRMIAEQGNSGASSGRQFQFLPEPILVPSFTDMSVKPVKGWADFLSIPQKGILFEPSSSKVSDAFASLLSKIEFGTPLLSEAEKDATKNARKLLYDPPDSQNPSKAFTAYKKKVSELGEWQKKEQDQTIGAAERNIAAQRAQELSEQLAAWPNAQGLTAAEELLARFSAPPSEGVTAAVKTEIESMISNSWPEFLRQVEDPSGWSNVSSSGKLKLPEAPPPLSTRITVVKTVTPEGKTTVLPEPRIVAWQFSYKAIKFPWGEFPAQLGGRTDWRLNNNRGVSTGSLEDVSATGSVLPQTSTGVWVIRNASIWFEAESAKELLGALAKRQTVRIGTLEFPSENTFYTRRSVHCSQPIIVAAEIKAYPLLPTPNPKIQWKK